VRCALYDSCTFVDGLLLRAYREVNKLIEFPSTADVLLSRISTYSSRSFSPAEMSTGKKKRNDRNNLKKFSTSIRRWESEHIKATLSDEKGCYQFTAEGEVRRRRISSTISFPFFLNSDVIRYSLERCCECIS